MNTRDAWRWPLRSRGRLIALVLAGLALALITKTIVDNATSTAAPAAGSTGAAAAESSTTAKTTPTAVPTKAEQCAAQWAKGPDRDACLYRVYGYTPSPQPTRNRTEGSSTPPAVVGVPITTTVESDRSGYLPEADQAAALEVTARFVDAWYAGGSDQAWRDQVSPLGRPHPRPRTAGHGPEGPAGQPAHHRARHAGRSNRAWPAPASARTPAPWH